MGQANHVKASMETVVFPMNSFKVLGQNPHIMKQNPPPNSVISGSEIHRYSLKMKKTRCDPLLLWSNFW